MERRFAYRWIWLVIAAATVAFIWQQSTLVPAESAEASDAVGGVLVTLFGGSSSPLGSFIGRYVRKIAHFVEFFLLGLEGECYLWGRHTLRSTALQLLLGLAVAASDELLQRFTGRGAAFSDVLLDVCGYLSGAVLLFLSCSLVSLLNKKRKVGAGDPGAAQSDA